MSRTPLVNNNNNQMENRNHRRLTSLGKRSHFNVNNNNSSTTTTGTTTTAGQSTAPAASASTAPILTPAQMHSNFEEWIKLCTDNKVNATNTWNFALIDYFHEMTFIREGDSINFQKASCTLDGCIKIYTSRVDSVATETGKLLSGLADSSNNNDGDDDSSRQAGERRARRKTHKSEATLLKDFSSIQLKKFDLDFAVDPLFKKTSADFDEGGARGLLLNHLSIDQHCKIIFDASDATIECDTEELDGEDHHATAPTAATNNNDEEVPVTVEKVDDPMDEVVDKGAQDKDEEEGGEKELEAMDIDNDDVFRSPEPEQADKEASPVATIEESSQESRVEISRLKAKLPTLETLKSLHIVPSLKGFDFFTENNLEIPNLEDHDDDEPINNPTNEIDDAGGVFQFDEYDIDYGQDDMDPFSFDHGGDDMDNGQHQEQHQVELDNSEKNYQEQDFLTAMMNSGEKDLFSYFDNTLTKNWAGPEHWKLRRPPPTTAPAKKSTAHDEEGSPGAEEGEKPKKRQKAAAFQIAFDDSDNDEDEDELFAPATRKITLTSEAMAKMTKNLLPDDIHFSSKQLLQYFLKPMFPSDPTKRKINNNATTLTNTETPMDNGSAEPDIDFWAQNQDFGQDYGDDMIDHGDDMPTDAFNDQTQLTEFEDTSFYHDNYDDPEVSVLYGDPLITNHHLKKSKPLYVNYARTAKRVDVKKLKDNLWKALTLAKPPLDQQKQQDQAEEAEEKIHGVQKFTDIVNTLKKMYSPKAMRDISVPFCFICLLHLANEKDLSIMGVENNPQDDDDFVLGDEPQGDWMNNGAILNEVTIVQN